MSFEPEDHVRLIIDPSVEAEVIGTADGVVVIEVMGGEHNGKRWHRLPSEIELVPVTYASDEEVYVRARIDNKLDGPGLYEVTIQGRNGRQGLIIHDGFLVKIPQPVGDPAPPQVETVMVKDLTVGNVISHPITRNAPAKIVSILDESADPDVLRISTEGEYLLRLHVTEQVKRHHLPFIANNTPEERQRMAEQAAEMSR